MKPAILFTALLSTAAAVSIAAAPKPADVIHYRQSVMTVIGWNFGPMVGMVKGEVPWDAKEFAKRAEQLASLAPQALEGFSKGSDKGAKTKAKEDIWSNFDDFRSKYDDLVKQTQALATVSASGDKARMIEQFKHTAGACKACHKKYKAK